MLLGDFAKFILPEVIGCPDPVVEQAVLRAAFQYCDESGAWDEVMSPIAVQPGLSQYEIDFPPSGIVLRIRDAWMDGTRIPLSQLSIGSAGFNSADGFGILTLTPAPTQSSSLIVRAVFAPSMTAKTIPDFLMQRCERAISSGAKAQLMLMNAVSWANPSLGSFYQKTFEHLINEARNESIYDRAGGSLYVKPARFR